MRELRVYRVEEGPWRDEPAMTLVVAHSAREAHQLAWKARGHWSVDPERFVDLRARRETTQGPRPDLGEGWRGPVPVTVPDGVTSPMVLHYDDVRFARLHRELGWREEDASACVSCDLYPHPRLPESERCGECEQCGECGHAEDCPEVSP